MRQLLPYFIYTTTIAALMSSCTQKKESEIPDTKIAEYRTYFLSVYKKLDSTVTIDSFKFQRLDTITEKKFINIQSDRLLKQIDNLNDEGQSLLEEYKQKVRQANLIYGISSSLYANYKSEANDVNEKITLTAKKMRNILNQDSLLLLALKKPDTLKTVGYQAICFYQLRKKDASVVKDTAYLTLNIDKNIVEKDDFYRY